jgi:hypothetical protein
MCTSFIYMCKCKLERGLSKEYKCFIKLKLYKITRTEIKTTPTFNMWSVYIGIFICRDNTQISTPQVHILWIARLMMENCEMMKKSINTINTEKKTKKRMLTSHALQKWNCITFINPIKIYNHFFPIKYPKSY